MITIHSRRVKASDLKKMFTGQFSLGDQVLLQRIPAGATITKGPPLHHEIMSASDDEWITLCEYITDDGPPTTVSVGVASEPPDDGAVFVAAAGTI